jgi:hypothetical protein
LSVITLAHFCLPAFAGSRAKVKKIIESKLYCFLIYLKWEIILSSLHMFKKLPQYKIPETSVE